MKNISYARQRRAVMRTSAAAMLSGVILMLPCASLARTREPLQGTAKGSAARQTALTWDRVLLEMSTLEAAGKDAEVAALLERFVRTNPKRFEPYVALAQKYEKQGRFAEAADMLRKGRKAVPDMPAMFVLSLIQYDVQSVTESPALPRADAARFLSEASTIADQLIAAKQEVRMAMMAKSLALKVQAERVEQTDARKKAVMAESDDLLEKSRFTSADGSPIAKTVDDEWLDVVGTGLTGPTPGPPAGPAIERFVAAHPDFLPARMALGSYHQDLGDAIADAAPSSAAARTQHFKDADAQFTRALTLAHDPSETAAALSAQIALRGPDRLNRPAEAETMARSAIAKYPDQPALLMSLASVLLPPGRVPTDAAVRRLRDAAPPTAEAQHIIGTYLWEAVNRNKDLPRPVAAKLLTEATASFDAALKMRPDYMEAIVYKGVVLRLRAERVEQDPARIKALLAEADRLREQATRLRSGGK